MIQYNNIYIVTDIKGSTEYRAKVLKKLVDYVYDNQMEDILKRIIVQIYNEDEYDAIAEIYPFDNWIFTLYMRGNDDLEQIIKYCIDKHIPVVTMPEDWISSNDYLDIFEQMNIKVYVHTINDLGRLKGLFKIGVNGIYTDFIIPKHLEAIKE